MAQRLDERFHRGLYFTLQRFRGRPIRSRLNELRAWEQLEPESYRQVVSTFRRQLLEYAAAHVPLYRTEPWRSALAGRDVGELDPWPVLEKATAVRQMDLLGVSAGFSRAAWRVSSNSSGHRSMRVAVDPVTVGWSWAHEYRALQWHGIEAGMPTLACMHNMMRLPREARFQDWVRNRKGFFANRLTPERIDQMASRLAAGRFELCWGLPSVMFQLARHVRANYPAAPRSLVRAVKLGGEPVYRFQREQIQRLLGTHVAQNYGCTEVGPIASECSHGRLHIFATHVAVEVFHGDQPAPRGAFGDLVVTSLGNRATPVVRCRIGDRGRLSDEQCPCGMPLPVMERLTSRTQDKLVHADGRAIHGSHVGAHLHELFDEVSPAEVRQVQLQQLGQTAWRVIVETDRSLAEAARERIVTFVQRHFGQTCAVEVEAVRFIDREPSGKFRYYQVMEAPSGAPGDEVVEAGLASI